MNPPLQKSAKCEVLFAVNGEAKKVLAHPMERLLDVLRNDLGLMGAKEGCGEGECGSCSVLLDGMLVNSCLMPVAQANGASIVTIEGMSAHHLMTPLQEAFLQCGGAQCGICTPGMILAAVHLLEKKPRPELSDIREGLAGNLCRCTGYMQIFEAGARAERQRAAPLEPIPPKTESCRPANSRRVFSFLSPSALPVIPFAPRTPSTVF